MSVQFVTRSSPQVSILPSVQVDLDNTEWINGRGPLLEIRNKCYLLLIKQDDSNNFSTSKQLIKNMSKILVARPKLVLTWTDNHQMTNLVYDESILFPWIVLTNHHHHKVTITCPGCGTKHHGTWSHKLSDRAKGIGAFSKNLQQPLCCVLLKGSKIRISHNNLGYFWNMKNNNSEINTESYEGWLMSSFLHKYDIRPQFLNANLRWGSLDGKTKRWNGGVGNVRKHTF